MRPRKATRWLAAAGVAIIAVVPIWPSLEADGPGKETSPVWETLGIAIVLLVVALVFDGLRVREAAIRIARDACGERGVQFLDYTVQGARTQLARDGEGHTRLRRTFLFDFSDDGISRRAGSVVMLGSRLESLQLEPYRLS